MFAPRESWSEESTDRIIEGVVIGVGVALLCKLSDWLIDRIREGGRKEPSEDE